MKTRYLTAIAAAVGLVTIAFGAATANAEITGIADHAFYVTGQPDPVTTAQPGDSVSLTVTGEQSGTEDANATVVLTFDPAQLTFGGQGDASAACTDDGAGTVTCTYTDYAHFYKSDSYAFTLADGLADGDNVNVHIEVTTASGGDSDNESDAALTVSVPAPASSSSTPTPSVTPSSSSAPSSSGSSSPSRSHHAPRSSVSSSQESAAVVVAAASPASPAADMSLASTGTSAVPQILIGVALAVFGSLMLLITRRRHAARHR